MSRVLYLTAFTYIAICGVALVVRSRQSPAPAPALIERVVEAEPPPPVVASTGSGADWFARMKQYCNPVEVDVQLRFNPPPSTSEGSAYTSACFALAGKIDSARATIERMPRGERQYAADVVFNVAHPVADAGDDRSAGPIMGLVVDYSPRNYMALYHAGASEYALGQSDLARKHLRAFLELYGAEDGWRSNAKELLSRMAEKP